LTWLGACAAALSAGACDGGGPPPRGFGSRQLVPTRDATLAFTGYSPGHSYYATGRFEDSSLTYWRLDVETGVLEDLGPSPSPSVGPVGRLSCTDTFSDTGTTLTVTDTQTGVTTTIDRLTAYIPNCPTDVDSTISAWRRDGTGHLALWSGRYDDLLPVPVPLLIDDVIGWGGKLGFVIAELPEAPGAVGIFGLDGATYAVSPIVPPTLAAATWAEGATPAGGLESATIENPNSKLSIDYIGGRIFYARTMSDGGTTVFVSPFVPSGAGERALFRVDGGARVDRVGVVIGTYSVPSEYMAWEYETAGADRLLFWDPQNERLLSCPGIGNLRPIGYANSEGRHVLFGVANDTSVAAAGPVMLVSPDGDGRDGACTQLAADAQDPQLSTDGSMTWLVDAGGQGLALWTAAADGTGARELGRGSIELSPWAPYFFAPSRLELRLDRDLAWVDVRDDPVKMHYVAQQVFDRSMGFDDQVLIGYDFNDQDGTGRLGLVDRETGAKRLISPEVVTYDTTGPSAADSPVRSYVIYLVRGRNPSPQDGLWVATINKDDVR
jgi:hypothetical protein